MAGGKVHHWKHGWIPLDATVSPPKRRTRKPANWVPAADNKPKWSPPSPTKVKQIVDAAKADDAAKRKTADKSLLSKNYSDMTPAEKIRAAEIMYGKGSPKAAAARKRFAPKPKADRLDTATKAYSANRQAARLKAAGIADRAEVDGITFDTYEVGRDDLGLSAATHHPYKFTPDQQKQIAATVNELAAAFPGVKKPTIIGYNDIDRFGVTAWDGQSIHLSKRMFDQRIRDEMRRNFGGPDGAIAAAYTDDEPAFVRALIAHEFGHVLQMQNAHAKITASDRANQNAGAGIGGRYTWDNLPAADGHPQTVYSNENEYEWFAEAFADGYLHGDQASESGKWAVNMLHNVYGGQA